MKTNKKEHTKKGDQSWLLIKQRKEPLLIKGLFLYIVDMKQFIVFLLILIFPFSQKELVSFEEMKSIDSFEAFERIMIEKGFEPYTKGFFTTYAWRLNPSNDNAQMWATWYEDNNTFSFQTIYDKDYDNVFDDVKNQCEFYGILENTLEQRHSCYTCPGSKYAGKICFMYKSTIRVLLP